MAFGQTSLVVTQRSKGLERVQSGLLSKTSLMEPGIRLEPKISF